MSSLILLLSESYHVPMHSSIVTIETIEKEMENNVPHYYTSVSWGSDPDEDVLLESSTREEAIQRHERLCRCFRKYQWFWKPVRAQEQLIPQFA